MSRDPSGPTYSSESIGCFLTRAKQGCDYSKTFEILHSRVYVPPGFMWRSKSPTLKMGPRARFCISLFHFDLFLITSASAASPTLTDPIMKLMEAHWQSNINDVPAALLMTGWIIQTGWKILTHVGILNLYCPYNFFFDFLWRARAPIWLAYDGPALFVYLLTSLRASSSPLAFMSWCLNRRSCGENTSQLLSDPRSSRSGRGSD